MMETEETQQNTSEPQVTEPMDEATSNPSPPPAPQVDQNQFFTLEDVPPSKWRSRILEILAWAQVQSQKPFATQATVIAQILPRFLGRLKEWWTNLGQYRQMQDIQSVNIETFVTHIHNEFVGAPFYHINKQREEYLQMKCYSFQKSDLERHYSNMSSRFYAINGLDDTNLKQAYLNFLPDPLGNETSKLLSTKNLTVTTASLGEIYQNALLALEKFCNTSKFLKQLDTLGKKLGSACTDHISIKCKDEKACDYRTTKKSHFKKSSQKNSFSLLKWQFLKKKKFKGKTTDTCYICKKRAILQKIALVEKEVSICSSKQNR